MGDATRERLKYAVRRGKAKRIHGGVYAAIPPGVSADSFWPDPILVAAALRPDTVISYHSALELLGATHSDWNVCTVSTLYRHTSLALYGLAIRFLCHPSALVRTNSTELGCRKISKLNHEVWITGPEKTLLDEFRRPNLVGGLGELVDSASGFASLDYGILFELLEAYSEKKLWGAVGWFLERFQETFFVDERFLAECAGRSPGAAVYLLRSEREGILVHPWNLMVPENLVAT